MDSNNNSLQPREAVRKMRSYSPPTQGRRDMLRLDFNENTTGCSPLVLAAVLKTLSGEQVATYPEYSNAINTVASFLQVESDELMLTNGTDEAIQVLVQTFVNPGDEVVVLHPSYAMYRFYAEVAGATVTEVEYLLDDDLAFPLESLLRVLSDKTKGVFIANPNNPTGRAVSLQYIEQILQSVPHAVVLVDEAYVEFSGITALDLVRKYSNLFVSRTFSKAYGMAGLRCGCLVSQSSNIAWSRKAQSPYSVNVVAAIAASAAVLDTEWVSEYVRSVVEARTYLVGELRRLGIRQFPTDGNFVLINVGEAAQQLVAHMREKEILIRDRSHEIPGCVRVTIGTIEQMKRFINELENM